MLRKILSAGGYGGGIARPGTAAKGLRPGCPGLRAKAVLQGHKVRIVRKPGGVFPLEALYLLPIPQPAPVKGLFQHGEALRIEPPVIYIPGIYPGAAGVRLVPCQQAVLYQEVKVNEIRVPGEGGKALVGGIAEARLAQGSICQHR